MIHSDKHPDRLTLARALDYIAYSTTSRDHAVGMVAERGQEARGREGLELAV